MSMKNKAKIRRQTQFSPVNGSSLLNWDNFACIFFVFGVVGTFIYALFIVSKTIHSPDSVWPRVHWTVGCFLLHNIMGNFIMIIYRDSTIRGKLIPQSSLSSNRGHMCITCESCSPPRSHHCAICNICILKRDHHCTFARTCIGYFNYRYFLPLILHIFLGSLYATVLNMLFIWRLLGGFNLTNVLAHTFPFIFWMFGKLPFYQTICCIISVINIAANLFTLGLLFYYGSMVAVNQTGNYDMSLILCRKLYMFASRLINFKSSLRSFFASAYR